ncbi:MAG TPA: response regulator transcription factor [Gemmatimonadales bacterium]|nr:response regulator transcription factor [Gemmatimonadales bacterium]
MRAAISSNVPYSTMLDHPSVESRSPTPGSAATSFGKSPSASPTVHIVDDDASVRKSLARLLKSAGYRVETYEGAQDFLVHDHAPEGSPQCLVLDVRMPKINGLDLQTRLCESGMDLPVIFATGHGDVPSSVRAMKVGAVDFLTKPIDDRALLGAVERGLALDAERQRTTAVVNELKTRLGRLTPREREVLALVVTGMLNKQIAGRLGTCERTIKVHRARVMKKMQAGSVAELVRMADLVNIGSAPIALAHSPAAGSSRVGARAAR